jgi:hypothetical protein
MYACGNHLPDTNGTEDTPYHILEQRLDDVGQIQRSTYSCYQAGQRVYCKRQHIIPKRRRYQSERVSVAYARQSILYTSLGAITIVT